MKWFNRLKLEKLLKVSGLCGMPSVSYMPKRFTQLYRALYGARGGGGGGGGGGGVLP